MRSSVKWAGSFLQSMGYDLCTLEVNSFGRVGLVSARTFTVWESGVEVRAAWCTRPIDSSLSWASSAAAPFLFPPLGGLSLYCTGTRDDDGDGDGNGNGDGYPAILPASTLLFLLLEEVSLALSAPLSRSPAPREMG